jgi:hypothetical protein
MTIAGGDRAIVIQMHEQPSSRAEVELLSCKCLRRHTAGPPLWPLKVQNPHQGLYRRSICDLRCATAPRTGLRCR